MYIYISTYVYIYFPAALNSPPSVALAHPANPPPPPPSTGRVQQAPPQVPHVTFDLGGLQPVHILSVSLQLAHTHTHTRASMYTYTHTCHYKAHT